MSSSRVRSPAGAVSISVCPNPASTSESTSYMELDIVFIDVHSHASDNAISTEVPVQKKNLC